MRWSSLILLLLLGCHEKVRDNVRVCLTPCGAVVETINTCEEVDQAEKIALEAWSPYFTRESVCPVMGLMKVVLVPDTKVTKTWTTKIAGYDDPKPVYGTFKCSWPPTMRLTEVSIFESAYIHETGHLVDCFTPGFKDNPKDHYHPDWRTRGHCKVFQNWHSYFKTPNLSVVDCGPF